MCLQFGRMRGVASVRHRVQPHWPSGPVGQNLAATNPSRALFRLLQGACITECMHQTERKAKGDEEESRKKKQESWTTDAGNCSSGKTAELWSRLVLSRLALIRSGCSDGEYLFFVSFLLRLLASPCLSASSVSAIRRTPSPKTGSTQLKKSGRFRHSRNSWSAPWSVQRRAGRPFLSF